MPVPTEPAICLVRRSSNRRILNEEEVVTALSTFVRVEVIQLDALSYREQVHLLIPFGFITFLPPPSCISPTLPRHYFFSPSPLGLFPPSLPPLPSPSPLLPSPPSPFSPPPLPSSLLPLLPPSLNLSTSAGSSDAAVHNPGWVPWCRATQCSLHATGLSHNPAGPIPFQVPSSLNLCTVTESQRAIPGMAK